MSNLSKYFLNKPVEMYRITILVPRSIVHKAVDILHSTGALHVETISKGVEEYVEKYNRVSKLLDKIHSLISSVRGIVVDVNITRYELETIDIDFIEKDVDKLYSEVSILENEKREIEENIRLLTVVRNILTHIPRDYLLKNLVYRGRSLSALTILGRVDSFKQLLTNYPNLHVLYLKEFEQNIVSIIVYSSEVHNEIISKVKTLGFNTLELDELLRGIDLNTSVAEAFSYVDKLLEEYRNRLNEVSSKILSKIRDSLSDLCKYTVILENISSRLKTFISAMNSKYITVINGWIPKKKVDSLIKSLESENISFYYELHEPVRGVDEPPTMLDNPPVIQWYEPIIKFIGIPRYWEWDPTPLLAYSFAIFFGLMLGDMGFAVAIILLTTLFLDRFVPDPSSRDYILFKKSLLLSSIIGFVIGALSGSLFSFQPYTLTDLFIDPLKFLLMSLVIGLVHVNISHVLTLIKSKKTGDTGTLISEIGLFIVEIFGIPYVLRNILNYNLPLLPFWFYNYSLYFIFTGMLLIIIGMVKQIGFLGLLMWIFNITGLIGDVLSYSRLAGVGLATIYLGASFNTIAIIVMNGLKNTIPSEVLGLITGGVVALIVLIFGYLLNTILSAIGCFVHSLRLCFIEFLSKFYEGTGYLFEPLRVVIRKRIVLE